MTHISFYILATDYCGGPLAFACEYARRVYHDGISACLLTADAAMAEVLDQRLWEDEAGSFVPHQQWTHNSPPENRGVLLGWDEPPAHQHELLINLGERLPLCFSRFDRLVEIIDAGAPEAGRERYQFYRDRGYPLKTHKIAD